MSENKEKNIDLSSIENKIDHSILNRCEIRKHGDKEIIKHCWGCWDAIECHKICENNV